MGGARIIENFLTTTILMKNNVSIMIQREEKLSDLDARADNLEQSSARFATTSRRMKEKMWWENMKTKLCIGISTFVIVILIIIIILHQLGLLTSSSDGSQSDSPSLQLTTASTNQAVKPSSGDE